MGTYTDREKAVRASRQQQHERQEPRTQPAPAQPEAARACEGSGPDARSERQIRLDRERMAGPPPRREQAKYGPRGCVAGDDEFRRDRAVWYENFTGRSIAEVSLHEQNDLCDAIARRFREYTDSRATREG